MNTPTTETAPSMIDNKAVRPKTTGNSQFREYQLAM